MFEFIDFNYLTLNKSTTWIFYILHVYDLFYVVRYSSKTQDIQQYGLFLQTLNPNDTT
jgi:hypothetical protein